MDGFRLTIHGTGYPLPGGYDELLGHLCITMSLGLGVQEPEAPASKQRKTELPNYLFSNLEIGKY
jgi:hypothetical protein